ncbi:MAG: hypothetical protein C0429_09660 [Sphingopyxis sp.]|nr:hypothetical protein [Sphingopyxis sp.]
MKKEYQQKAAEMIGKRIDVDLTTKAVSIDETKHTATFVMSTASIDRHGDIVDQDSWILDHFVKNAPLFWGHRSNDFPLGKWLKVWLEPDLENPGQKMLMGTAEFAVEVADDVKRAWAHVVRGDLNMVSVGFIPHVVEYDENKDAFVLKECELIECSLVGIGANRRALIKDADIPAKIIELKQQIEESISQEDVKAIQKRNGILMLNKAVRAFQK